VGRRFLDETTQYWHEWVRNLAIPYEWQEAVIRAAITLKLNAYDDTGAIIAAMTTSIPEAAGSTRNWDYRYCWLRDGYFVVNALNRLGATRTMERYLAYIINIAADGGPLQPVYGIDGRAELLEQEVPALSGYHGAGARRQPGLQTNPARRVWLGHFGGQSHFL
jgi:GH15 family glucan-1,4-alpha-glucosidase